jgi:hypothetical protein
MQRRDYDGTILKAVMLACLNIAIKIEEVVAISPEELQVRETRRDNRTGLHIAQPSTITRPQAQQLVRGSLSLLIAKYEQVSFFFNRDCSRKVLLRQNASRWVV